MQETILESKTQSNEQCSPIMLRRVAAMLDLDTRTFSEGDLLPKGWHFFILAGETRKSELRQDGFPGLGVPIPDLGLPRLLLGGRTVSYSGDIVIGLLQLPVDGTLPKFLVNWNIQKLKWKKF